MSHIPSQKKAWGGVFNEPTDKRVEAFSESVSFDQRLANEDIDGSIAHAKMLAACGLMTITEAEKVEKTLEEIRTNITSGDFEFTASKEDIHLHIESALTEKLGDTGRKLHTARSRNDQVATDLRLFCRRAIDRIDLAINRLQKAFVGMAEREQDLVIPAFTHLRRAQPVLAAHQLLSWCEKLQRDRDRLRDCRRRTNTLPLGSGALAGTSLPIDRKHVQQSLQFESISQNSLDGASDRDFVCELAFVLSLCAVHLSQWAEEWIIWSTHEFGFLKLPEGFCTGSSIMPQKINPDVLELIRGKSARTIGNTQALLVLLKGLPTAYNRDLQEDKECIFDSIDTLEAMLSVSAPLVAGTSFNRTQINASIDSGYLDATSLMESLIHTGLPQRTAHETVGRLVRLAMKKNIRLEELSDDDCQKECSLWQPAFRKSLSACHAVERMQSFGSTAPSEVTSQLRNWNAKLNEDRDKNH